MSRPPLFLKRLELLGFKSFANKTVLEFPAGIVAVVGPNGSGKSNIVDALRWVLGEREARHLRSAKLENLIFSGSPKKPAVGLAHVSLHFNNERKLLPLDYEEVVVSRKADRSGLSEYYLNKSEIRLKELTAILAEARLGSRGLLIVNQGDSDILIKSSPVERRQMIEEAIGLRQYQLKKSEAERKLTATAVNLDKAKASAEEIKPHLRFLRRQTSRYQRRSEIAKELESAQSVYFWLKSQALKDEEEKVEPRLKALNQQLERERKESEKLEAELKKIEDLKPYQKGFNELRERHQKLRDEQAKIQKELGRLEGRLEILAGPSAAGGLPAGALAQVGDFSKAEALRIFQDLRRAFQNWLAAGDGDWEKIKSEIKEAAGRLDRFLSRTAPNQELKTLTAAKEKLLSELKIFEETIKEILEQESALTKGLEKFNLEFRKAFEGLEANRVAIGRLESEKNRLIFEKEKINFKNEELRNQAKEWNVNLNVMTNDKLPMTNDFNIADLEGRIFKLRGELAAIGEIDEAGLKEAQETEARFGFLTNQIGDLEKALADLKDLIKNLTEKINSDFRSSLQAINEEFNKYFRLMFGGGKAKFAVQKIRKEETFEEESNPVGQEAGTAADITVEETAEPEEPGLDIDLALPRKKIRGLASLSGGERSLVSLAALFALIAIKSPPFLVLDEIDAPLDEINAKRFAALLKEFSSQTQFIVVTHNRSTMEAADVLYGVTMGDDGVSKVLSLKLDS